MHSSMLGALNALCLEAIFFILIYGEKIPIMGEFVTSR